MNVTVEFDGVSEDLKKQIRTLIATRALAPRMWG